MPAHAHDGPRAGAGVPSHRSIAPMAGSACLSVRHTDRPRPQDARQAVLPDGGRVGVREPAREAARPYHQQGFRFPILTSSQIDQFDCELVCNHFCSNWLPPLGRGTDVQVRRRSRFTSGPGKRRFDHSKQERGYLFRDRSAPWNFAAQKPFCFKQSICAVEESSCAKHHMAPE